MPVVTSDHDRPFIVLLFGAIFALILGWGIVLGANIDSTAAGLGVFGAGVVLLLTFSQLDPNRPILDDGSEIVDANRWYSTGFQWPKPSERAPDSDDE